MMDNRYREELDRIRLTEESKGALAAALAARRSAPERRSRRAPCGGWPPWRPVCAWYWG